MAARSRVFLLKLLALGLVLATFGPFLWHSSAHVGGISADGSFDHLSSLQVEKLSASKRPAKANSLARNGRTTGVRKCALCFFGLPRSFEVLVLPSLVKNVLEPNSKYGCDVYVHYYTLEKEPPGRFDLGGRLDPGSVEKLRGKVRKISNSSLVTIVSESEEEFWQKRKDLVDKYETAKWHSIQSVWEAMKYPYERVAMMRLDVFYALPIDIFQKDKFTDAPTNDYAVVPGFALFPVNDRMIYGPYKAVKIWATERFERLESHVRSYEVGYGMHSERFLNHTIFPAIKNVCDLVVNEDICFFRTRADYTAWVTDCVTSAGVARDIQTLDKLQLIQNVTGKKCRQRKLTPRIIQVKCDPKWQNM